MSVPMFRRASVVEIVLIWEIVQNVQNLSTYSTEVRPRGIISFSYWKHADEVGFDYPSGGLFAEGVAG